MNARAAEVLYEAERKGVRQVKGAAFLGEGRCAVGVIEEQSFAEYRVLSKTSVTACPMCGAKEFRCALGQRLMPISSEWDLIVHLNDDHGLTFGEIARKLGPDSL